jgi:metal-responsive CopG/Arc/MetJ family transcriptional regulator
MRPPVKRANVDLTLDMIKELDALARELNISRQTVIKAYLRQALDQHY